MRAVRATPKAWSEVKVSPTHPVKTAENVWVVASSDRLIRSAAWFAYASGVVSVVQLALLGLFYARGAPFGTLNDAAFVVQVLLALPLVFAFHRLLQRGGHTVRTIALLLGVFGILAIAVLQVLLIARVLTFAQQVVPVTTALFVVFGGWLLLTGYLARSLKVLPNSMLVSVIGWTYFGYPIWAFWLGNQLRRPESRASSGD